MPSSGLISINVLTGFLGSGKTTVLNAILRHPGMATALVVVNEFGEIALDHDLIESVRENTIVLQSGCICCTVRNDLVETLREAFHRRTRGEIGPFDRVLVETTGLADPAPILQTLMTDPSLTRIFRFDGVIATVDAVAGDATLDRYMEAVRQAAVADRIIVTKGDLADEDGCLALEQRLRALNPAAPIIRAAKGALDPAAIFDAGLYIRATRGVDIQRWLDMDKFAGRGPRASRAGRHDDEIHSVAIHVDKPIAGEALDLWLQSLLRVKGPNLLRFKAIINVAELPGPIVAQGVQHVIYPPVALPAWPGPDRRTRMVFITHGIDEAAIRDSLHEFTKSAA